MIIIPQVVASFLALLGRAAGGADPGALAAGDWAAVPATLPTIALAFVYQNVVPVIASSLEARHRGSPACGCCTTFLPCRACCVTRRPTTHPALPSRGNAASWP